LIMRYRKQSGDMVEFTDARPGVMVIYNELVELQKSGALETR